ncbi:MAG: cobalamin biosynthesis protein P47K [Anaerolineae bacterium]|nr:cobalamin biosynthesis protein P47K [Anaerolineae bacterium]
MAQPMIALVGGFLGAGKTTFLLQVARRLSAQGRRVGIITNDQGEGLVDTALVRGEGLPAEEIAGGCFCCRFDDLINATQRLAQDFAPDFILAEPVGSCTDLAATVVLPIQRYFGQQFRLAPLTILVDPFRAHEFLFSPDRSAFPSTVGYLYLQQLAEADILAINKTDLAEPAQLHKVSARLQALWPRAKVLALSALTGAGVNAWMEHLGSDEPVGQSILDIDYETYAEAEAALGWLNMRGSLRAARPFSPEGWIEDFLRVFGERLRAASAEIAHVKVQLAAPDGSWGASKASITRGGEEPFFALRATGPATSARLLLNARVNTEPATLERCAHEALDAASQRHGVAVRLDEVQSFRPSPPRPTHRLSYS